MPAIDGWLVLGYEAAIEVMRDGDTFTVDDPRFTTGRVVGPSMLSLDGAEHQRHRSPFVEPFRPASIGPLVDWVAVEARRLVGELVPAGRADLRSGLAAPLAVATIHRSLGIEAEPATMLGWYREIVAAVTALSAGEPDEGGAAGAMAELRAAVAETVDADPDSLLARVARQGTLAADEVARNAAIVMFGGIETGEGMTANALLHLLDHPDQLARVAADRALISGAIDESLRLEPAASVVDRYTTADVAVGDASIRAGDLVRVSLAAANRDPDVFADPDRFDVVRPNARLHLAFAVGPHTCLGSHLARAETAAAIGAVLDLLPGVSLDPDRTDPPRGLVFRKPARLGARW